MVQLAGCSTWTSSAPVGVEAKVVRRKFDPCRSHQVRSFLPSWKIFFLLQILIGSACLHFNSGSGFTSSAGEEDEVKRRKYDTRRKSLYQILFVALEDLRLGADDGRLCLSFHFYSRFSPVSLGNKAQILLVGFLNKQAGRIARVIPGLITSTCQLKAAHNHGNIPSLLLRAERTVQSRG